MELGIFMMPLHPPHRSVTDTYQEDLDKIILADKLGYTEAWVGQHFTAGTEPIASPFAFMSAAIPVISWRSISSPSNSSSLTIIVPGSVSAAGASSSTKDESTCTRTYSFIARLTERVCKTFEPTEASSSISS